MRRLADWDARLAGYLDAVRLRPFGPWGSWDCCVFADGGVVAMTGESAMAEFTGRYASPRGAARALRRYGAGTLQATLDAKFAPVPASFAQRGDIVMTDSLLGLCGGGFLYAVGSESTREGLIAIERAAWQQPSAWRVPY